jgi:putative nucleotidyltransferase with HDIG domain
MNTTERSNVVEQYIDLLSGLREGMDDLLEVLQAAEVFSAPCSTQYHLSKPQGLVQHSLNVYDLMRKFNNAIDNQVPEDSVRIVALLHDVGKADFFGRPLYMPNILKSGKQSESKPYVTNSERLIKNHAVASLVIVSQYIPLTEDEAFAILYHNGLYDLMGREISGHETLLQQLLHFADMCASRFYDDKLV